MLKRVRNILANIIAIGCLIPIAIIVVLFVVAFCLRLYTDFSQIV